MTKFMFRLATIGILSVPLALCQTDAGRIVGTVTDPSGAVVPGAAITVSNEKTGQERKATSDSSGQYIVPNLAPSTYKITADAKGFGQWQAAGVPLSVGQERSLPIVVQPASIATEVSVS